MKKHKPSIQGSPPAWYPSTNSNQPIAEQIARQLTYEISSGQIPFGKKLQEVKLAKRFDSSRAPVREALRLLEQRMLVEIQPFRGARALWPALDEIDQIMEAHIEVVSFMAYFAAGHITDRDMAEIRATVQALSPLVAGGIRCQQDAVILPLYLLNRHSPNRFITELGDQQIFDLPWLYSHMTPVDREERAWTLNGFQKILAALEAEDPDLTEALVSRLLRHWKKRTLSYYSQQDYQGPSDPAKRLTVERKNKPLSEQVAILVVYSIMDGRRRPGERLREQDLATQFQVSRAPIREALRILEREGLICRENWKGAHIHKISPEEVAELMVLRESLFPRLMRLAVLNAKITEIRVVCNEVQRMVAAIRAGSYDEGLQLYGIAGMNIRNLCSNPWLSHLYKRLAAKTLYYSGNFRATAPDLRTKVLDAWLGIADALLDQDVGWAEAAAKRLGRLTGQMIMENVKLDNEEL